MKYVLMPQQPRDGSRFTHTIFTKGRMRVAFRDRLGQKYSIFIPDIGKVTGCCQRSTWPMGPNGNKPGPLGSTTKWHFIVGDGNEKEKKINRQG